MLEEAPHRLQTLTRGEPQYDEYGRQTSAATGVWRDVTECFCHDNSQLLQVSVNGELWTYDYHVVYEGAKLPLGTEVRCLDEDGAEVGRGVVKRCTICHSTELKGRCDIWLEQKLI